MADGPKWFQPDYRFPERKPAPGELLFEFVRASDRASMSCELRFHGESFGWEAQLLARGELHVSRGAFPTRAAAVAWADGMRKAMESESWGEPLTPIPIG
jgi:hypothetical protein